MKKIKQGHQSPLCLFEKRVQLVLFRQHREGVEHERDVVVPSSDVFVPPGLLALGFVGEVVLQLVRALVGALCVCEAFFSNTCLPFTFQYFSVCTRFI